MTREAATPQRDPAMPRRVRTELRRISDSLDRYSLLLRVYAKVKAGTYGKKQP